jgi:hypothetical protein
MIILDPIKLREYWDGIAQDFHKSPLELIINAVLIFALFAVVITLLILFMRKEKRKRTERARKTFEKGLTKRSLAAADQEDLRELVRFLPGGKESDMPALLNNPSTFNAAAHRMIEKGRISESRAAQLRVKLGLIRNGFSGTLRHTEELEEGTPVTLSARVPSSEKFVSFHGVVKSAETEALVVTIDVPFKKGQNAELQIARSTGLYSVDTRILKASDGEVYLEHSLRIKRIQKRRYFRKMTRLPAYVKPLDTEEPEASYVKIRLLDLGGGGARFQNHPNLHLDVGRSILLVLYTDKSSRITIKAQVIRISKDGSSVSITFDPLKDAARDRIMRLVLR